MFAVARRHDVTAVIAQCVVVTKMSPGRSFYRARRVPCTRRDSEHVYDAVCLVAAPFDDSRAAMRLYAKQERWRTVR
jgi:hypothetical protein